MSKLLMELNIAGNLKSVLERISIASKNREEGIAAICSRPRLVAVSKLKAKSLIIEAYKAGQRHFGENYIQELEEKAYDPNLQTECPDIRWHFIGHIQKNKSKKVAVIPNLHLIETIHNEKLATKINNDYANINTEKQLKVFVQVNTSREENKHGIDPENVTSLVEHIKNYCLKLQFTGVMTIGSFNHDYSKGPNKDFLSLLECRERICKTFDMNPSEVEVSMGMSNDFEHAISLGSTNVRVGSTIFGEREPKK